MSATDSFMHVFFRISLRGALASFLPWLLASNLSHAAPVSPDSAAQAKRTAAAPSEATAPELAAEAKPVEASTPTESPPPTSQSPTSPPPTSPPPTSPAVESAAVEAPELAIGAPVSQPPKTPLSVEPWEPGQEDELTQEAWYGWQTLVVDGVGAAALIGGGVLDSPELAGLGFVTYLFGAPIVHWSNEYVGRGFGSLGLRVASTVILVAGTAACASSAFSGGNDGLPCAVALIGVAAVPAAIAIDAAVFAYHDEPTSAFVPWLDRERRATGLLWTGRF